MLNPPVDVKHSGSDHPQGNPSPSFRTAPLWVVGEEQFGENVLNNNGLVGNDVTILIRLWIP